MTANDIDISKLGVDLSAMLNRPSVPPPLLIRSNFRFEDEGGSTEATTYLLNLIDNDPDRLTRILLGQHFNYPEDEILLDLPQVNDFSDGNRMTQVYLTLHRASLKRVLVFNRNEISRYRFLIPFTYFEDIKKHVVFMLNDPRKLFVDDASPFIAQSLFSIDVNFGLQSEIMAIFEQIKETISVPSNNIHRVVSLICKLFTIYRCREDTMCVSMMILDLLMSWKLTMDTALKGLTCLLPSLNKIFQFFSRFRAQSMFDSVPADFAESFVKPLINLAVCCATVVGSCQLPAQKQLDGVLHRMGNIGKAMSGFKQMTDGLRTLIDRMFEAIYEIIFGVPYNKTSLSTFLDGFQEWFEKVAELTTMENQDMINTNFKLCRDIEQLYVRGLGYLQRMKVMGLTKLQMDPFYGHWRLVCKLYDKVLNQGCRQAAPRTEPVIVHLFGSSGVGKSGLTYLLAQDMLAVEGLQENVLDETYFRNVEQEYWDGYHGQAIVVYDDFGQKKDTDTTPNPEFMEIIRSGNIAPWPLHMAMLEEKAKTRFLSRGVILTSNERIYNMDSLTHKDAVERRKDLSFEVLLKDEYKTLQGRLNTSLVSDALDSKVYKFRMWENGTLVCEYVNGNKVPVEIDYDQMVDMVQQKYVDKFIYSKHRLDFLQTRGKHLRVKKQDLLDRFQTQGVIANLFGWRYSDPVEVDQNIDSLALLKDNGAEETMSLEAICFPYVWVHFNKNTFDDSVLIEMDCDNNLLNRLKSCAQRSANFDEFLISGRSILVNEGIEYQRRYNSTETWRSNLFKSVSSECKKAYKFGRHVFTVMCADLMDWWHSFINGDTGAFLGAFYTACVGSILWMSYKANQSVDTINKESAAAEELIKETTNQIQKYGLDIKQFLENKEIKSQIQDFEVEHNGNKMICYYCYRPGHSARRCSEKKDALERRALYEQTAFGAAESREDNKVKPKTMIVESKELEKKKPKVMISESKELEKKKPKTMITESRELEKRKPNRFVKESDIELRPHYFNPEAFISANAGELISTTIPRNTYMVYTWEDEMWKPRVNLVFVRGRCAIIVSHAVPFLRSRIKLCNAWNPQGLEVHFDDLEFIAIRNGQNEDVDANLVVFPNKILSHKDILKHFVTQQDLSSFNSVPGNLYACRHDDGVVVQRQYSIQKIESINTMAYFTDQENSKREYAIRRGYVYYAETKPGDCTGVLVASSNALPRKIIGIHVAGARTGQALAQSITSGMIERALTNTSFSAHLQLTFDDLPLDETKEPVLPEGDFIPIGKLSKPVFGATKSELRESPLYELVKEPTTMPALLRRTIIDGETIDPIWKGLKKCGVPNYCLDSHLIERSVKSVFNRYRKNYEVDFARVLTHEESIMGIPGEEFLAPINRRSSPGWPWTEQREGSLGKTKWLGSDEHYDCENQELLACIEERIAKAKLGIRTPTLWVDTLKDERRPINKVMQGKTRVFSAGAMDYILAFRRYFLGFFSHLMKNRIGNGCAVGINPYSVDWQHLHNYVTSKGEKVIAGDFSNFDGSLIADFLHSIKDHINEWYELRPFLMGLEGEELQNALLQIEEDNKVRTVLFEEIVHSIHINGDNVYMWTHSQPSGNPGTVIINSIFNESVFRYAFVQITGMPLYYFDEYIAFCSYGDDNLVGISDKIADVFNQVTITKQLGEMGLTYTDEAKTGDIVKYRTIEDVGFLKRGFKYDKHLKRQVAPLELDTILEMTMWVRGDLDHEERCHDNVALAYRELSLHGKETFTKWSNHLDRLCLKNLSQPPPLYDYQDYKMMEIEKWF